MTWIWLYLLRRRYFTQIMWPKCNQNHDRLTTLSASFNLKQLPLIWHQTVKHCFTEVKTIQMWITDVCVWDGVCVCWPAVFRLRFSLISSWSHGWVKSKMLWPVRSTWKIKTHNVTNKTQYWNIFIQTHTGPVNVFGCFIIIYDNIQWFFLFIQ